MSHKQGQDSQASYTDNIRVKISERYKPPRRINLAMSYSQRLTVNKQIQDTIPSYEFALERTVKENMAEWRSARSSMYEGRKLRLEEAKEELKKQIEAKKLEKEKDLNEEQVVASEDCNSISNSTILSNSKVSLPSTTNQTYSTDSYSTNMLMPTQVSSTNPYSNILTPIPLGVNQKYTCNPDDKSPFNISDFENDTSSPFDNMELQCINEMEQLAQVLKSKQDCSTTYNRIHTPVSYNTNYPNVSSQVPHSNYYSMSNQYSYNIPSSSLPYSQQPVVTSTYSRTNGYYYHPDNAQPTHSFNSHDLISSYEKQSNIDYNSTTVPQSSMLDSKKTNFRSVPDILKALEVELGNSHIDCSRSEENRGTTTPTNVNVVSGRPKSTDAVYPTSRTKQEELEDPFKLLPKNQQDLCKNISSMGFPLPRVARTCKLIGDDHKKIVEHLLALSDLLDLGFSEKAVSSALLQCDNDRDKALDKLIT